MNKPWKILRNKAAIRDVVLALAGTLVFALYIHEASWLRIISFLGLIIAALTMALSIRGRKEWAVVTGTFHFSFKSALFSVAGILTGALLAFCYRNIFFEELLPSALARFAFIAPLIGITEELVFRGYIQGKLRFSNPFIAVCLAAVCHTLYKYILLKALPDPGGIDFTFLVTWTFIGGVVFGTLRELSGNIIPPALAHGTFDILVYGGFATAPVWVWG